MQLEAPAAGVHSRCPLEAPTGRKLEAPTGLKSEHQSLPQTIIATDAPPARTAGQPIACRPVTPDLPPSGSRQAAPRRTTRSRLLGAGESNQKSQITSPPAVPYRATLFGRYLPYRVRLRPSAVHVDGRPTQPYSRQSCIGRGRAQLLFWPAEAARSRPPPAPTRPKGKCSSCRRPLPCRPIACASLVPMAAPPAPLRNTGRLRMVAGFAAPASLARSPSHKDRAELPLSRRRPVQARRRREFAHTQLELIERSF